MSEEKNSLFTPKMYQALVALKNQDRIRGLLLGFVRGKTYHSIENRVGAWNVFRGPNDTLYQFRIALHGIDPKMSADLYRNILQAFHAWATPEPSRVVPCGRKFYRKNHLQMPEVALGQATALHHPSG